MPPTLLNKDIAFPPLDSADENGILAVGGDLLPDRLLLAYRSAIFPWYSDLHPILWWSPDPRFVLFPAELHIPASLQKTIRKKPFRITFDSCFRTVISECRDKPRPGQPGTWITDGMLEAYCNLHDLGYAHSCEAWEDDILAGGLYGVSIGGAFFGESMFFHRPNASHAAFVTLTMTLRRLGFDIIDSQVYTGHMAVFGARMITRKAYADLISRSTTKKTILGNWGQNPLFQADWQIQISGGAHG